MAGPSWDDTTPVAANEAPVQAVGDTPTWDSTQDLEEKYGGVSGAAKAFALSAARTAIPGADYLLTKTGITTPENIRGLEEQNPVSTMAGVPAGILGALAAPETGILGALSAPVKAISKVGGTIAEAAAPVLEGVLGAAMKTPAAKVLSQAGAHALGSIAEGEFYTLGNAVSESALGDPDAFGEKLLAASGTNALISGSLGALFGGVKGIGKARELSRAAKAAGEDIPGAPLVADAPKTGVQPIDLQDMQEKVLAAKASGKSVEMPQKAVLEDALSRIEMENPVHPLQLNSLVDQGERDLYNTAKETPGKTGDSLRNYEAIQKNELVGKVDKAISDLAPGFEPTADAVKGGDHAIKLFSDQYQAEKEASGKLIGEIKSLSGQGFDHELGGIKAMTDAVPEIAQMFDASTDGIKMLPYSTKMGMTKQTYRSVRDAVKSLRENPQDFKELFNIRKGLENGINMFSTDAATVGEVRRLKAGLMDYIQSMADKSVPEFRDSFRRYAVNEQERGVIEKAFGASVGTPEFGAISKVKPELIGDKIFANTATVQAAKNILGPEKFNEILANHLSELRSRATDKGAFSSNKFASILRNNKDALGAAFSDNPTALQRLGDLTTIMRILPDAASINPSGTAKTLFGMLKDLNTHDLTTAGFIAGIPKTALKYAMQQKEMGALRDSLAGKTAAVDGLSTIERMATKATNMINKDASSIFSEDTLRSAIPAAAQMYRENHDRLAPHIQQLNSDPEKMMNRLEQNTDALHEFAPQTAAATQAAMIRATQFLNSKLPGNGVSQKPLSPKYVPSKSEISKWHSYYNAVESPTNALKDVSRGTLVPETMETLAVVYPKLLKEMQLAVTDKMTGAIAKKKEIPYRTKLMLSIFLGSDLVNSLDPKSMLATQNTMATATAVRNAQENQQMNSVNKKSTGKIEKSNRTLTAFQANSQRQEA